MKASIDLDTDGQLQLTPKAAAILADIIRKALADQQRGTGLRPTGVPSSGGRGERRGGISPRRATS